MKTRTSPFLLSSIERNSCSDLNGGTQLIGSIDYRKNWIQANKVKDLEAMSCWAITKFYRLHRN